MGRQGQAGSEKNNRRRKGMAGASTHLSPPSNCACCAPLVCAALCLVLSSITSPLNTFDLKLSLSLSSNAASAFSGICAVLCCAFSSAISLCSVCSAYSWLCLLQCHLLWDRNNLCLKAVLSGSIFCVGICALIKRKR